MRAPHGWHVVLALVCAACAIAVWMHGRPPPSNQRPELFNDNADPDGPWFTAGRRDGGTYHQELKHLFKSHLDKAIAKLKQDTHQGGNSSSATLTNRSHSTGRSSVAPAPSLTSEIRGAVESDVDSKRAQLLWFLGRSFDTMVKQHSELQRVKIFVYDLPSSFNSDLELKHGASWMSNILTFPSIQLAMMEPFMHREMLSHNPFRTTDPDDATLLFVPVFAASDCARRLGALGPRKIGRGEVPASLCDPSRDLFVRAIEHIKKTPAGRKLWSRRGGTDHVLMAFHPFGPCMTQGPTGRLAESLANVMFLTPYGDKHYNDDSISGTTCFRKLQDVVVAPWFESTRMLKIIRRHHRVRHDTHKEGLKFGLDVRRDILVYFRGLLAGELTGVQPEQSHLGKLLTTRRQLITNLTIDGAPCGKECGVDGRLIKVTSHLVPWEQYTADLARSVFCLCPASEALWSYRFFHSIAAGCLPVLYDDGRTVLPYADFIKYTSFVVRIAAAQAQDTLPILAQIDAANIKRMQEEMQLVRNLLVYITESPNHERADSSGMHPILYEMSRHLPLIE